MEEIDNKLEKKDFKGPVPYSADKDPEFMNFMYARDKRVREEMQSFIKCVILSNSYGKI